MPPKAYLSPLHRKEAALTVEIAVITWTNALNNDTRWFSFVFLQERVSSSDCEVRSVMLWAHKQYLSSANLPLIGSRQRRLHLKTASFRKLWRKRERKTHGAGAWIFAVFEQIYPCLTNSLQPYASANIEYSHLLCAAHIYMTRAGTGTRLIMWEGIKGTGRCLQI